MVSEEEYLRMQQEQQFEALKKQIFMRVLDDKARSRLSNIRVANPQFAAQVELALIQLIQTGRYTKIDEDTLVTLIKQLRGKVQKPTISRM